MVEVDELKPIGWEWAADSPSGRVQALLPVDRDGCPVCGHPTGDCTGGHVVVESREEAVGPPAVTAPESMKDSPPAAAPRAHEAGNRLLDKGSPDAKGLKGSSIYDSDGVVKQNVYEEVQTPLAKRKSYRLAYVRGQQLTKDERATLAKG